MIRMIWEVQRNKETASQHYSCDTSSNIYQAPDPLPPNVIVILNAVFFILFQRDSDFEKSPVLMFFRWVIILFALQINPNRGESKSEISLSLVVFLMDVFAFMYWSKIWAKSSDEPFVYGLQLTFSDGKERTYQASRYDASKHIEEDQVLNRIEIVVVFVRPFRQRLTIKTYDTSQEPRS